MPDVHPHNSAPPSTWVRRFAPLIAPGASVLDLACGQGRHMRWLAEQGFRMTGVDRDPAAIAAVQSVGEAVLVANQPHFAGLALFMPGSEVRLGLECTQMRLLPR